MENSESTQIPLSSIMVVCWWNNKTYEEYLWHYHTPSHEKGLRHLVGRTGHKILIIECDIMESLIKRVAILSSKQEANVNEALWQHHLSPVELHFFFQVSPGCRHPLPPEMFIIALGCMWCVAKCRTQKIGKMQSCFLRKMLTTPNHPHSLCYQYRDYFNNSACPQIITEVKLFFV